MEPYPWTCPFCDRDTTITSSNHSEHWPELTIENTVGRRYLRAVFVVCPNPECNKFTLTAFLHGSTYRRGAYRPGEFLTSWRLIPPSQARAFPDYVPKAVVTDYEEACLIRGLSPKASATLSRRCLQGMIRDFWGVQKPKLAQEIEAIKDKVDPLTWGAIDAVRGVGNIGAHMERDINLIIDVEPEEAAKLIWLIELLVKDWYVNRHEREEGLKEVKKVGEAKTKAKKKASPATAPLGSAP